MPHELQRQKRKFVRVKVGHLPADVQIVKVANIAVESGEKRIAIVDISPGGLRFITDLRFPLHAGIVLGFHLPFLRLSFRLTGVPVWSGLAENVREYGIVFMTTREQQIELMRRISEWVGALLPNQLEILQMYRKMSAAYEKHLLGGRLDQRI